LAVRPRGGEQFTATPEELGARLLELQGRMPMTDLNQPRKVTERPLFVG
jgi:hypothetical protein